MSRLLPLLILLGLLATHPARALEIGGASFPEQISLGGSALTLNGAGLRTRFLFKVYAIGLYLPQKVQGADAVLATRGPRRLHITTLRELTAEQLTDALLEAIEANHSAIELSRLNARIAQLRKTMLAIGKVPEKTRIQLDFLPGSGTRISLNEQAQGEDIAGEDFFTALLRIWLGKAPVQADLRDALAGLK